MAMAMVLLTMGVFLGTADGGSWGLSFRLTL